MLDALKEFESKPDFVVYAEIQKEFWEKDYCIVLWCNLKATDSHIISQCKLRENCEWGKLYNPTLTISNEIQYREKWIKSISKKIRCNNHDSKFFSEIDNYYFNFDWDISMIEKFALQYSYRVLWYAKRQLDSFLKYTYLLQRTENKALIKRIRPDWKIKNYDEYNIINKIFNYVEKEITTWFYNHRNLFILEIESNNILWIYAYYYDTYNRVIILLEAEKNKQYLYIISFNQLIHNDFRDLISKYYHEKNFYPIVNLISPNLREDWVDLLLENIRIWKSYCSLYI